MPTEGRGGAVLRAVLTAGVAAALVFANGLMAGRLMRAVAVPSAVVAPPGGVPSLVLVPPEAAVPLVPPPVAPPIIGALPIVGMMDTAPALAVTFAAPLLAPPRPAELAGAGIIPGTSSAGGLGPTLTMMLPNCSGSAS